MVYIPRLYNPHPLICLEMWRLGFRIKKIEDGEGGSEWIKITPREWNELEKEYDRWKALNTLQTSK